MRFDSRSRIVGGISVLVLLAGSAGAFAANRLTFERGNVIRACVQQKYPHTLTVLEPSGRCVRGETLLTWNARGASGPRGPIGPMGAQGTAGTAGAPGANGSTGPQGPQGLTGVRGLPGSQGPQGPAGTNGTNGTDGTAVLSGTGAPGSGNPAGATAGDFYIDTSTDTLYGPMTQSGWPSTGTSLIGQTGQAGTNGANGTSILNGTTAPSGSTGGSVGDFYLDTANDTLYGPMTLSGWPATGTSLIGQPGPTTAASAILTNALPLTTGSGSPPTYMSVTITPAFSGMLMIESSLAVYGSSPDYVDAELEVNNACFLGAVGAGTPCEQFANTVPSPGQFASVSPVASMPVTQGQTYTVEVAAVGIGTLEQGILNAWVVGN